MTQVLDITSEAHMRMLGGQIARLLKGGECLELVGDVGAGKTTLVKGIALGLGIDEAVQSPSFTISRVYASDSLSLHHYDFYRLPDAGILEYEFAESVTDPTVITIVEWADVVHDILPEARIRIAITPLGETSRRVTIEGDISQIELASEGIQI